MYLFVAGFRSSLTLLTPLSFVADFRSSLTLPFFCSGVPLISNMFANGSGQPLMLENTYEHKSG